MTMNRHEPFEELISASLHGDLSADERPRLDAHLDTCASAATRWPPSPTSAGSSRGCGTSPRRATSAPGCAPGSSAAGAVPWWRRPATILAGVGGGLAVVAGALLALVLLNGPATSPKSARPRQRRPWPSRRATTRRSRLAADAPPLPSDAPPPSGEPHPPSAAPSRDARSPPRPEPDVFLAVTGHARQPGAHGSRRRRPASRPRAEADTPSGEPIAAELSPDGQWLAYITAVGLSGMNEMRATRVADAADDPSAPPPDSRRRRDGGPRALRGRQPVPRAPRVVSGRAVPRVHPRRSRAAAATDAWVFETNRRECLAAHRRRQRLRRQLGRGRGDAEPALWVSTAGASRLSY